MPDPLIPSNPDGPPSAPSNPETAILSGIEQEQLNNFLGPVNGALGGLPVAERNQSYFAVFTGAGGTGPEIINQTAMFITYIVDENGNVSKPSEDYDSLYNLIQNFEVGKNAIVRNDAPTALNGNIAGGHLITAVGRQESILYSQTGSSAGANVNKLFFNNIGTITNIPRFTFWLNKGIKQLDPSPEVNSIISYNPAFEEPESTVATVDNSEGTYTVVDLTSPPGNEIIYVRFSITMRLANSTQGTSTGGVLRLMKDGVLFSETPFSLPQTIDVGNPSRTTVTHIDQLLKSELSNGEFSVQIAVQEGADVKMEYCNFKGYDQFPNTSQPIVDTNADDFWKNNNGNNLWVTASEALSLNYQNVQNSQNVLDEIEPGFNFSPVEVPFIVQAGDRIRFEYSETLDYTIYEIIEPSVDADGRLKLRLNTLIPNSINLNNFVLHRINTNDPAYIILNVKKNNLVGNTQNFNGVILPKYPTKRLKDNLDNILLDLKSRGIITDNEN